MPDYKRIGSSGYVATIGGSLLLGGFATSMMPLVATGAALVLASGVIGKKIDAQRKKHIYSLKNYEFATDIETIRRKMELDKDFYLFLRPLDIAGTIQFSNQFDENPRVLISFEEALSRSLDSSGQRTVFCVGDGKEHWGVANIIFNDEEWKKEIIKLFKACVAIISIPGLTSGCLNESTLIRNVPNLLKKTVFVIPPISCYREVNNKKKIDVAEYFEEVRSKHADIGISIPKSQIDTGVFFTVDSTSGNLYRQLGWQNLEFKQVHKSSGGSIRSEKLEVTPTLTADRIRSAIRLTTAG
jgi:hypothetical protein